MKICSNCKQNKLIEQFYKGNGKCKDCKRQYQMQYYAENYENVRHYQNQYAASNKEQLKQYNKQWRNSNRSQQNKYKSDRLKNVQTKIAHGLRVRIGAAIKHKQKVGSAVKDLGCTIEYFVNEYIPSKFKTGMSWNNYGEWHLDHIVPLASFDLTDKEQFIRACHYTNYQPLWALDNLKKGKTC